MDDGIGWFVLACEGVGTLGTRCETELAGGRSVAKWDYLPIAPVEADARGRVDDRGYDCRGLGYVV